jgi:hypothetical protein
MADLHSAQPLFEDASRFLFRLDLGRAAAHFLNATPETFQRSTFLDNRIAVDDQRQLVVPLADLLRVRATLAPPLPPLGFLFHTAFCCSTLLARALQAVPRTHVLREPLALRDLADARRAARARGASDPVGGALGRLTLDLLGKTFEPHATVVIKPTNLAANFAWDALSLAPHARGVVLSCSYDAWIVSCMKKLPDTRAKMPWLAAQLLLDDPLSAASLDIDATRLDETRAMVLVWFLQRRAWSMRLAAEGGVRLRSLDAEELLADPLTVLERVRYHLDLNHEPGRIAAIVAGPVWNTHAKDPKAPYDATRRAAENAQIRVRHREPLARARVFHDWLLARYPLPDVLPHPLLPAGRVAAEFAASA